MGNKIVPNDGLLIERLKRACEKGGGRVNLDEFKIGLSKQHKFRNRVHAKDVDISESERLFAMHLRREKIDFVEQYEVESYVVDFMIPEYGVLVEIDGFCHFMDDATKILDRDKVQHHYDREKRFIMDGWRVIRFTSYEVYQDPKFAVLQLKVVLDWLDSNKPVIQTIEKEKLVEKEVEVPKEKIVKKEIIKEIEKPLKKYPVNILIKHLFQRILRR